jgi:transmembrane sensor
LVSSSDFRTLLLQVISGEISAEDKALFYDLILDNGKEEECKNDLKDIGESRSEFYSRYEFKSAEWKSIKQRILMERSVEAEPIILNAEKAVLLNDRTIPESLLKKMPVRKLSWISAAAASVIVLLGLTLFFKFVYKAKTEKAVEKNSATVHDVAPGGNRATLTLGNGATITLDSESIGVLAQQGNTRISKTDSGRLSYSVEKGKPVTIEENILTTPRGGQYQLELPDGTKVWLNSASSITYPTAFSGSQRFVIITGEVYFEVVHNASMPFVVKAGNDVITDLGTSFNINAYREEGSITTTLLQGSVKIFVGSKTNLLFPGQQEITSVEGESATIKKDVDTDKVVAWKSGKMSFAEASVRQLMNEISRWYDVDIEYSGSVPNKIFYGSISRDVPLSTILNALRSYGLETKMEGKKVIVK